MYAYYVTKERLEALLAFTDTKSDWDAKWKNHATMVVWFEGDYAIASDTYGLVRVPIGHADNGETPRICVRASTLANAVKMAKAGDTLVISDNRIVNVNSTAMITYTEEDVIRPDFEGIIPAEDAEYESQVFLRTDFLDRLAKVSKKLVGSNAMVRIRTYGEKKALRIDAMPYGSNSVVQGVMLQMPIVNR